ncbi:MAG: DUF5618 family protein [Dysgonamonadaceae bacterium]|jgi:hypothetical protein|nr:DUF5618 family protein [Dysgonamonadaceae bacterium]
MATLRRPIREAEHYLQNALQILTDKAEKDGDYYNDTKYVRMAGNTAWNGVLIALDAALGVKDKKKPNKRMAFKDYQMALYQRDSRMNNVLLTAYETLHKAIGYDGVPKYTIVQSALADGQRLIEWADQNYHPTPEEIAEWERKPNIFQRIYSFFFL